MPAPALTHMGNLDMLSGLNMAMQSWFVLPDIVEPLYCYEPHNKRTLMWTCRLFLYLMNNQNPHSSLQCIRILMYFKAAVCLAFPTTAAQPFQSCCKTYKSMPASQGTPVEIRWPKSASSNSFHRRSRLLLLFSSLHTQHTTLAHAHLFKVLVPSSCHLICDSYQMDAWLI